jgi:glycerol kinase
LSNFLGIGSSAKVADLAAQVESTEGIYVVPALVGLGAPYWDANARGLITGLTHGSKVEHVARAVIESIAYQIRDVFDVMQSETDDDLTILLVDGGGTRNDQLMQFQADILGVAVQRNNTSELSAMGAAYLAGLCVGVWSSIEDIAQLNRSIDLFEPRLSTSERAHLYKGWQQAIARTRLHLHDL